MKETLEKIFNEVLENAVNQQIFWIIIASLATFIVMSELKRK